MTPEKYRQMLVEQIQGMARDIEANAADIVGETDLICDMRIVMRFPQDSCPSYTIHREHASPSAFEAVRRNHYG